MDLSVFTLIARRLGGGLLTLLIVSLLVFFVSALLPGDAAQQALGQFALPEQVAALRAQMGLDQPALLRYVHWLSGLLHGDLGQSLASQMPITSMIGDRLGSSLMLAGVTALVSVPLALGLGIVSAMNAAAAWTGPSTSLPWASSRYRNSWWRPWRCWSSPCTCSGPRR